MPQTIDITELVLTGKVSQAHDYTPASYAITNVDAITMATAHYCRVGDMVEGGGTLSWDATAANTFSQFALSLPIAATFANVSDCFGGSAAIGFVESLSITADTTNNRILFQGICGNTSGAHTISYWWKYRL